MVGRVGRRETGVELTGEVRNLVGLALRENPKRAHLLVSRVLGKHIPQRPGTVYGTGFDLGRRVRALLGDEAAARAVVLGYAETATGLGHSVADGLGHGVPYLHSTRRAVPGAAAAGTFEETHSHATGHLLLPEDPALLAGDGPLVLVDDEFSTGNTVRNTIAALHAPLPPRRVRRRRARRHARRGRPAPAGGVRGRTRRPRPRAGARRRRRPPARPTCSPAARRSSPQHGAASSGARRDSAVLPEAAPVDPRRPRLARRPA